MAIQRTPDILSTSPPSSTPLAPPPTPTSASSVSSPGPPSISLNGADLDAIDHLQDALSSLSHDRAETPPPFESEYQRLAAMSKVLTIAISGATSSGKTTLAIILAAVFTCPSSSSEPRNIIIHEDNFFYNKGACESVTFPSKPADVEFCLKTLRKDEVGEYVISREKGDRFRVSGPDTDHISAVNFGGIVKAVRKVRENGTLPPGDANSGLVVGEYGCAGTVRVTQAQINSITHKYSEIITKSRIVFQNWLTWQHDQNTASNSPGFILDSTNPAKLTITPTLLFIEGFLLYHKPSEKPMVIEDSETEDEETRNKMNFAYGRMGIYTDAECRKEQDDVALALLSKLEKKNAVEGAIYTDKELEYVQEHHMMAVKRAMKLLMPMFNVKLFLPTSMAAAKERRLKRREYVDVEAGGQRKPGQMWKTEGYFEYVAWKNHVLHHDWLVGYKGNVSDEVILGESEDGIFVREPLDAGVEETVIWAVTTILTKFTAMEQEASR